MQRWWCWRQRWNRENQRTRGRVKRLGPRMKVGAKGAGRLKADQGWAAGTREPREAIWPMVFGCTKGWAKVEPKCWQAEVEQLTWRLELEPGDPLCWVEPMTWRHWVGLPWELAAGAEGQQRKLGWGTGWLRKWERAAVGGNSEAQKAQVWCRRMDETCGDSGELAFTP